MCYAGKTGDPGMAEEQYDSMKIQIPPKPIGYCAHCIRCVMRVFLLFLSAGVGRTGVFITLSIVLERMRYEGVVDLFQTVKTLRTQRPAMVQTEVWTNILYCCCLPLSGEWNGGKCSSTTNPWGDAQLA